VPLALVRCAVSARAEHLLDTQAREEAGGEQGGVGLCDSGHLRGYTYMGVCVCAKDIEGGCNLQTSRRLIEGWAGEGGFILTNRCVCVRVRVCVCVCHQQIHDELSSG